jgi:NAD-dependent dihydropyrimidine dehydrogenase PreA subunit
MEMTEFNYAQAAAWPYPSNYGQENQFETDVMVPDPEEGKPPIVLYPDECWFCGCCVAHCPVEGAIVMEHPLNQRVGWKRKETGDYFRIGMKNPPPPNTKPPVC